jgi:hypothetical protein
MSRPAGKILLSIALLAASFETFAQSQPTPRPPLGPGDSFRQFPEGLQHQASPVASDSITVTNLGNVTLKFSAWDGASSWRSYQVAPGESVSISCGKCGSAIPIDFNDGAQNRRTSAKTADAYALYWDKSQNRWDFASIAALVQSRGPLR